MRKLSNNFVKSWLLVVSLFVTMLSFVMAGNLFVAKADTIVPVMNFEQGASVRINSDGLRFRVEIDQTTRDYIVNNDNVTMGFFIAPTNLMTAVQDGKYENMEKKIEVSVNEEYIYENANGNYFVNGCVYNFLPANRAKDYTAVAFVKVDNEYLYSDLSVSRGIYSTLNLFITSDNVSKANVNSVMATYAWFGNEEYPIVIASEKDYANICALVEKGVTFENLYLKVTEELFVADMPSGFNGNFTTDSEKIFNYGYKVKPVGEKTVGTVELPTANKVDSANQIVEENVFASKVTFNGNEVAITNNTIEATVAGIYKVTFAGDETTIETTIDLFVRATASYADEIELFNDELFGGNFYLSPETYVDSKQRNATITHRNEYEGATGVIQIDVSYDSNAGGSLCGFNMVPRAMAQADLTEYDYIIVRAFVPSGNNNLTRILFAYFNWFDINNMPAAEQYLNWADPAKGQWFDYKLDLNKLVYGEPVKNVLTNSAIMSLELLVTGDVTIYIDSITVGKNSFGSEIIAQDANADGTYGLNEEVSLSIAGIDNASFTVIAPNGDKVTVTDNKFIPSVEGQYTITSNYLGVASKTISVAFSRVPYGENEIEAFSDSYFAENFYLSPETYVESKQRNATITHINDYEGATGVIQIDINYDENAGGSLCGFNMVPRAMTQADLTEYDYIIVRAFVPSGNNNLQLIKLGYFNYADAGHMPSTAEWLNWNDPSKGQWYEYKINLTYIPYDVEYRSWLTNAKIMSLEFSVTGNVTIYIDSITAGKNA